MCVFMFDGDGVLWCACGVHLQALVLAPTRELADQITEVMRGIGRHTGVVIHECVGGTDVRADSEVLRRGGVQVVVGTPGRVLGNLTRRYLRVEEVKVVAVDEADVMLERGFQEQVYDILGCLPGSVQVALFSATMPQHTLELSRTFMRDPVVILVKEEALTLEGIQQYHVGVEARHKMDVLMDLYGSLTISQAVIFVNTHGEAERVARSMCEHDFAVSCIHGKMAPEDRRHLMSEFRSGHTRVLVATDLIARGIDVQQVSLVINYSLPLDREMYIHRIGRSGRYGREGVAINLICGEEVSCMRDIESFYRTQVRELPGDLSGVNATFARTSK
jgi:translation initiation factor 4A